MSTNERMISRRYLPKVELLEDRCLLAAGLTEFAIPTAGSGPQGIVSGPDGNLWFTENATNQIGRISTSGGFAEFPILTPGSDPAGIALGPDHNLWFTEFFGNKIGQATAAGSITDFPLPTANAQPQGITSGPDGNLWFTEGQASQIGRINPGTHTVTEFPLPSGRQPTGIITGLDGNLWFTQAQANRIGRMNSAGSMTGEFTIPTADSSPQGITAGPDGALWFTEEQGNRIGRITTGGTITEFALPSPNSGPHGITLGPDGGLWFVETNAERIGRISPAGVITEVAVLAPGTGPLEITAGPDGNLWLTERDANRIARQEPLTPNQLFVELLYHDLLHRAADADGFTYFSTILDRGLVNRFQVSLAIETSLEHRIVQVIDVYAKMLDRFPDLPTGGFFVNYLGQGHTVSQMEVVLASTPEYFQKNGGTSQGFVTALFRDGLRRDVDAGSLLRSTQALRSGMSASQLAAVVFTSREYQQDVIQDLFQQLLGRPADGNALGVFLPEFERDGLHDELLVMTIGGSAEFFSKV